MDPDQGQGQNQRQGPEPALLQTLMWEGCSSQRQAQLNDTYLPSFTVRGIHTPTSNSDGDH